MASVSTRRSSNLTNGSNSNEGPVVDSPTPTPPDLSGPAGSQLPKRTASQDPNASFSSDCYYDDDPAELARMLEEEVLPGDVGYSSQDASNLSSRGAGSAAGAGSQDNAGVRGGVKRRRDPYDVGGGEDTTRSAIAPQSSPQSSTSRSSVPKSAPSSVNTTKSPTKTTTHTHTDDTFDVYGPSKFGGFGEYMTRKRAKLQVQNEAIASGKGTSYGATSTSTSYGTPGSTPREEPGTGSVMFRGIAIYINGWTKPSVQELRTMVVERGGVFQPYLDKKSIVTHIITTSLTPSKMKEFQNMKVVRPEWVTKSIEEGRLLPWQEFMFKNRLAGRIAGAENAKVTQTGLFEFEGGRMQIRGSSATPNTSFSATPSRATPQSSAVPPSSPRRLTRKPVVSSTSGMSKAAGGPDTYVAEKARLSVFPKTASVSVQRLDGQLGRAEEPSKKRRFDARLHSPSKSNEVGQAVSSTRSNVPSKPTPQPIPSNITYTHSNLSPATPPSPEAPSFHFSSLPSPHLELDTSAPGALPPLEDDIDMSLLPPAQQAPDSSFDSDYVDEVPMDVDEPAVTASSRASSSPSKHAPKPGPITPSTSKSTSTTTSPTRPKPSPPHNPYATHTSNPTASHLMQSRPGWAETHTSMAGSSYISNFYANSRLHHLSAWKAELKKLVKEAGERAGERDAMRFGGGDGDEDVGGVEREGLRDLLSRERVMRLRSKGESSIRGTKLPAPGLHTKAGAPPNISTAAMLKGKGRALEPSSVLAPNEKIIMHCDFDCFFVAAGLVSRPHLKGKPVVVCHSQSGNAGAGGSGEATTVGSTSEIASSSYEAREFGIKNGMSLQQAKKLCPQVVTIPYEFERYKQFSLLFYTVLMRYADDLQAVSVDEALIDVTQGVKKIERLLVEELHETRGDHNEPDLHQLEDIHPAKRLAEMIRADVREPTDCEISIGISTNILLSRLATRYAKPHNSYLLLPASLPPLLDSLDLTNLHGFGHSLQLKAQEKLGSSNLAALKECSKDKLCKALGKATGEKVWDAVRGRDVTKLESGGERRTVSCDITYGIRFQNQAQVKEFILSMGNEVSRRLKCIDSVARTITMKVLVRDPDAPVEAPKFMGHGSCTSHSKQSTLVVPGGGPTDDPVIIGNHAWKLLQEFGFDEKELRGLGVSVGRLDSAAQGSKAGAGGQPAPGDQSVLSFGEKKNAGKRRGALGTRTTDPYATWGDTALDKGKAKAEEDSLGLPTFSQLDRNVWAELPAELRDEIEEEYKKRGVPTSLSTSAAGPSKHNNNTASTSNAAGPSKPPSKGYQNRFKGVAKQFNARGRPALSSTMNTLFSSTKPKSYTDLPPNARKKSIFAPGTVLRVSPKTLKSLKLEPDIFYSLPPSIQREQLSLARFVKANNTTAEELGRTTDQRRIVIKNVRRKKVYPRLPNPKARYLVLSMMKRKKVPPTAGGDKAATSAAPGATGSRAPVAAQVIAVSEATLDLGSGEYEIGTLTGGSAEEYQTVLRDWIARFRHVKPKDSDAQRFQRTLLQALTPPESVLLTASLPSPPSNVPQYKLARRKIFTKSVRMSTTNQDAALVPIVATMRWWVVLLRRNWKVEEWIDDESEVVNLDPKIENRMRVGVKWWSVYRDVKRAVDEVVKARFGGGLAIP